MVAKRLVLPQNMLVIDYDDSEETNDHAVRREDAVLGAGEGVTNGDSHDHSGGDGAQINHTTLSNIGSNTHAQIDTFINSGTNGTIQVVLDLRFNGAVLEYKYSSLTITDGVVTNITAESSWTTVPTV